MLLITQALRGVRGASGSVARERACALRPRGAHSCCALCTDVPSISPHSLGPSQAVRWPPCEQLPAATHTRLTFHFSCLQAELISLSPNFSGTWVPRPLLFWPSFFTSASSVRSHGHRPDLVTLSNCAVFTIMISDIPCWLLPPIPDQARA